MGFSGKIVVIGNSHAQAIKTAAQECGGKIRGIPVEVYALHRKERTSWTDISVEEAREIVLSLSSDDALFSAVGGNRFHIFGLMDHSQSFDVWSENIQCLRSATARELIPQKTMEDALEDAMKQEIKMLKRFSRLSSCSVFHIEAPPPKEDNSYIERNLDKSMLKRRTLSEGVGPPSLRLGLWYVQRKVLQRLCNQLEIRYLTTPRNSLAGDGYLRREYYGADATHANPAYGALVLDRIAEVVLDANYPGGPIW